MMKSYQPIVGEIARAAQPCTILDLPSGEGWLANELNGADVAIDTIDLYEGQSKSYRGFLAADLDGGVPESLGRYDMIVSCEGIEHIASPGLFLKSAKQHLYAGGTLVVTTPNT
jgi:2-polyprenyl-3-methyl-5-hydroxy-6-metoxy-1,4-benzoquinol methylase